MNLIPKEEINRLKESVSLVEMLSFHQKIFFDEDYDNWKLKNDPYIHIFDNYSINYKKDEGQRREDVIGTIEFVFHCGFMKAIDYIKEYNEIKQKELLLKNNFQSVDNTECPFLED